MKDNNPLHNKSFLFAYEISKASIKIKTERKEFDISRQLLRSGTSVAANIEEALGSFSNKDFYHKLSIAYKEARESKFWIRLIIKLELIDESEGNQLLDSSEEMMRLIGSIQKTMRRKYGFGYK